jgi:hypothetical protein
VFSCRALASSAGAVPFERSPLAEHVPMKR